MVKIENVVWERKSQEDPLTLMRRPELQDACKEMGVKYDPGVTTARELRALLRKAGYGHEDTTQ